MRGLTTNGGVLDSAVIEHVYLHRDPAHGHILLGIDTPVSMALTTITAEDALYLIDALATAVEPYWTPSAALPGIRAAAPRD